MSTFINLEGKMRKIVLSEKDLPEQWYNIQADMPKIPSPPLNPQTNKPVTVDELNIIFPMSLIEQEVSTERWIKIPEEVLKIYASFRPTPLYRATTLEKVLQTPARIYFKHEGIGPAGSHKTNTSIPQAYYNKKEGIKRISTETGAGQWGAALALAGTLMGIEVTVYMVKVSYEQKPYRRIMMETWGAKVHPSPSEKTESGKKILKENPRASRYTWDSHF